MQLHILSLTSITIVSANLHLGIDKTLSQHALVLHEDVLAKTLSYELEMQAWRRGELRAGRGDPGRPEYKQGYPVCRSFSLSFPYLSSIIFKAVDPQVGKMNRDRSDATDYGPVTAHRLHSCDDPTTALAVRPSPTNPRHPYYSTDCPGIGSSTTPFPVISTLLSIPFSVLHNIPRLGSMVDRTDYQKKVFQMGNQIIDLYSWDPSPEELEQGSSVVVISEERAPFPHPIFHPSRTDTRMSSFFAGPGYHASSTLQLPSGQVLLNMSANIVYSPDGLQLISPPEDHPHDKVQIPDPPSNLALHEMEDDDDDYSRESSVYDRSLCMEYCEEEEEQKDVHAPVVVDVEGWLQGVYLY